MRTEKTMDVKPGDWVRFEYGGTIVLGIVQYVDTERRTYPYEAEALTDMGRVALTRILECRRDIQERKP